MPSVAVVVPAGGTGIRLGRRTPKQYLRVAGIPILLATVRRFLRHPSVRAVVVAAPAGRLARTRALLGRSRRVSLVGVEGGATRQESVWRALQAAPEDVDIVLVHDAVRPFITARLVDDVIAAAAEHGAAVCALPIAETVKRARHGLVVETVDRAGLVTVQTPQGFRAAVLREAHDKARRDGVEGTDDAMLVERLGHAVRVVAGHPENVKITTADDLRRARRRP